MYWNDTFMYGCEKTNSKGQKAVPTRLRHATEASSGQIKLSLMGGGVVTREGQSKSWKLLKSLNSLIRTQSTDRRPKVLFNSEDDANCPVKLPII